MSARGHGKEERDKNDADNEPGAREGASLPMPNTHEREIARIRAECKRRRGVYEGACLDPSSPDYDCAGSGDGPDYTGFVRVVGPDDYGLDGDGDGEGCE